MKKEVNAHEAKTHWSRLLKRVAAGEEIAIANRGNPVARLIPFRPKESSRLFGMFRRKFVVPEDSDASLPDELLDAFEGRETRIRKRREIAARH